MSIHETSALYTLWHFCTHINSIYERNLMFSVRGIPMNISNMRIHNANNLSVMQHYKSIVKPSTYKFRTLQNIMPRSSVNVTLCTLVGNRCTHNTTEHCWARTVCTECGVRRHGTKWWKTELPSYRLRLYDLSRSVALLAPRSSGGNLWKKGCRRAPVRLSRLDVSYCNILASKSNSSRWSSVSASWYFCARTNQCCQKRAFPAVTE